MIHACASPWWRHAAAAVLVACGCEVTGAAPLTVSLPVVHTLDDPTPDARLRGILTVFLTEKLAACPGVRLVPDGRNGPLLQEFDSGVIDVPEDGLLAAYSKQVPVDAVVRVAVGDGRISLAVHSTAGVRKHEIPIAPPATTRSAVLAAAAWVGDALGLSERDRAPLGESDIADPAAFAACYANPTISVFWRYNAGERRLDALMAFLSTPRVPPSLIRQAFVDIALFFTDRSGGGLRLNKQQAGGIALRLLPHGLGTAAEEQIATVARGQPEAFAKELTELCKPLLSAVRPPDADLEDVLAGVDDAPSPAADTGLRAKGKLEITQQIAAVRLLGAATPAAGVLATVSSAAGHPDAVVRAAAAAALGRMPPAEAAPVLRRLADDADEGVRLAAGRSLADPPSELVDLARRRLASPPGGEPEATAVEILVRAAQAADVPLLLRLRDVRPAALRRLVHEQLLRLAAGDATVIRECLVDVDGEIVARALAALPRGTLSEGLRPIVERLATDPAPAVAQAAREVLAPLRPAEPAARLRFDLDFEHPWLRRKLLDGLAADPGADGLVIIEEATRNRDPQTRAHALGLLAAAAADRAAPRLREAILDPHRWVRLHAAALLEDRAGPADLEAIGRAVAGNRDPAVAAFLEAARARAEGRPEPPRAPPARRVADRPGITWNSGLGEHAADSPFTAYYMLDTEVSDTWRRCAEQGKIFFGRISVEGHPGRIIVDRAARDRFWRAIDAQLGPEVLPFIDGVVLGEETMNTAPDTLWESGWPLFCRDAGLDPARVAGSLDALTVPERQAWTHWSLERSVDGFNEIVRYIRLRHERLRPGLQVATFLPEESLAGGPANPASRRWEFDVGGVYDYKGDARLAAYAMVRRYRTLWPDRPVMWLSLGFGGYEMDPITHGRKMPRVPLATRRLRCYSDTVAAWLAGADPGWFSPMLFVAANAKAPKDGGVQGVQVEIEDIAPDGGGRFGRAVRHVWKDVAAVRERRNVKLPGIGESRGLDEPTSEAAGGLTLEDEEAKKSAAVAADIGAGTARFEDGMMLYQKYVYDCARVFNELPRLRPQPPVLVVRPGINRWSVEPRGRPFMPGMAILPHYDFLCDLDEAAGGPLDRYRLIVSGHAGPLRDATISTVGAWLGRGGNLLYVHRWLADDDAAEVGTPADHDGVLANDWPWEGAIRAVPVAPGATGTGERRGPVPLDVDTGSGEPRRVEAAVETTYECTAPEATVLARVAAGPVLVLWRGPRGGAVLFDGLATADGAWLEHLRGVFGRLHDEHGLGVPLAGPVLHVTGTAAAGGGTVVGDSAARYPACGAATIPGTDLLTGAVDPVVDPARYGTVAAREMIGRHVAVAHGIHLLAERPFDEIRAIDGGFVVRTGGLVRVASARGTVRIEPVDGPPLAEPADGPAWLIRDTRPGHARIAESDDGADAGTVDYFRAAGAVRITTRGE